ncbi:hypothetical protein D9T17_10935 [Lysobacter enzymogenes]|uniref:Uncharacterized protein n=1 Tax=Lysobacter enzymogenes TaxID=69 RepID=A0A3N2RHQ9_LYSEN|nr:hypothetical protein D9T17_10935 [Lysobacter enzymogenes]
MPLISSLLLWRMRYLINAGRRYMCYANRSERMFHPWVFLATECLSFLSELAQSRCAPTR